MERPHPAGGSRASRRASATKVGQGKIVDDRSIEQQAIDPIENTTMARQHLRSIFRAGAAFQRAFSQIAKYAEDVHYPSERQRSEERRVGNEWRSRWASG